jgi:RNA polymerase sigma-70 factor (ECF subfamily)
MSDLSTDAKRLLEAARTETGLSPEERARVRSRIFAAVGAGSIAATGATAKASAKIALSVKTWLVGGAVAALASGGTYYVHRHAERAEQPGGAVTTVNAPRGSRATNDGPNAAPVPGTDPVRVSGASEPEEGTGSSTANGAAVAEIGKSTPDPTGASVPVRQRSSMKAVESIAAPTASTGTGFARDALLLRDVRAALASGQPERAMAMLDARGGEHDEGVLAEEREAARIVTLCALGRTREAGEASRRFFAAHGSSPLAERVRRACEKPGVPGSKQ